MPTPINGLQTGSRVKLIAAITSTAGKKRSLEGTITSLIKSPVNGWRAEVAWDDGSIDQGLNVGLLEAV